MLGKCRHIAPITPATASKQTQLLFVQDIRNQQLPLGRAQERDQARATLLAQQVCVTDADVRIANDYHGVSLMRLRRAFQNGDGKKETQDTALKSTHPRDLPSRSGRSWPFVKLVRPDGFEPPTPAFASRYSIQPSYGRIFLNWSLSGHSALRDVTSIFASD